MAMDSPPTAISRLPSGARTQPGALRHGWRGCGGIARVLTGKHTHAAHTHAPNTPFNRPNACRKIRDKGAGRAICANRGFMVLYAPFEGGVAEWLKAAVC